MSLERGPEAGSSAPPASLFSLNQRAAQALLEQADLMDLQGESPFKSRAHRKVASLMEGLERPYSEHLTRGTLTELPGIGKAIAEKLTDFVETGTWPQLEESRREIPAGLLQITALPGLGVKKTLQLHRELEISTLQDLHLALEQGRVQGLKGFTERVCSKLAGEVERRLTERPLFRKDSLERWAEQLEGRLERYGRVELVGRLRRSAPLVGELELLLLCPDPADVKERILVELPEMVETEPSVLRSLHPSGCPVLLRLGPLERAGLELMRAIGPAEFAQAVEDRMQDRGEGLPLEDEANLFAALGLEWVSPEFREQERFWWAPPAGVLELSDLRGNLHAHTTASDGRNTLEEMVAEAARRGHSYFGLSDHSRSLGVAGGLSIEELLGQVATVRALRQAGGPVWVFASNEVDILSDGELDYPDEVLGELDYVVAAVHSHFQQDAQTMTERLRRAVAHPRVKILAHPSGRVITRREGYSADWEAVFEACAEHAVAVEINASPWRLDASDELLEAALTKGCYIAINTDAHSVGEFEVARHGVDMARRVGLSPERVINCWPLERLQAWFGSVD